MKKVISIIAVVAMLFAMSTSVFAYKPSDAAVTNATISDQTISYDPANESGFVFKIAATEDIKMMNYIIDASDLASKGWIVSAVDGAWSEVTADGGESFTNNKLQLKYANNAAGKGVNGKVLAQFKAVPSAGAIIEGTSFTVTVTGLALSSTAPYTSGAVKYTLAAAAQDTPATISAPNMAWAEYTVGNTKYVGVWTGAYTVTAGTKDVTDIEVAVNGAAAEALGVEAEAGGEVGFKIAVIGKPELTADGVVVTAVE